MGAALRRVVLDTNVVLSALLFAQGRLSWLRPAWQHGRLVPLLCRETATELLRVLGYPKFRLSPADRQALLAEFLPYAESFVLPSPWPPLPPCRDEADKAFLSLALAARADALVSGDGHLLSLREAFPLPICSPEALAALLAG